MKYLKVLDNKNQVYSEVTKEVHYPQQNGNFSVKVVFSGTQDYFLGRRQLKLYPDNFLIVNQGTPYSSTIDSIVPVSSFSLFFDPVFLNDFTRSVQLKDKNLLDEPFYTENTSSPTFIESIYPFTGDMKWNILHLKKHLDGGNNDQLLLNEYFHHCLINYYKIYRNEIINKSQNLNFLNKNTRIEILKRLTLAKDYILSNYNKNLSLDEISQVSCLSVNHFLRTFKQAFNKSPHQFLIQVRMNRATYLLKNTDYPINDIVEIIGFECCSSFIRLFKTHHNTTPGKYRLKGALK